MKTPGSIDDVASLFREEPRDAVEPAERAVARRARVVPVLEDLIASTATEARRMRWRTPPFGAVAIGVAALGAAAAIAMAVGWPASDDARPHGAEQPSRTAAAVPGEGEPSRELVPVHGVARIVFAAPGASVSAGPGALAPAAPEAPVAAGSRVTTESAGARAITSSGVSLELAGRSAIELHGGESSSERVTLQRGSVDVEVPPGDRARTFIVSTQDAEIVVHGTRFVVTFEDGAGTQLQVSEGVVTARSGGREELVTAGHHWSSRGGGGPESSSARATPRAVAPAASALPSAAPSSGSDLAEQNRAYAEVMAAGRRGDDRAVVAGLDAFLARWPGSPLAAEARAERERAARRLASP